MSVGAAFQAFSACEAHLIAARRSLRIWGVTLVRFVSNIEISKNNGAEDRYRQEMQMQNP